MTKKISKNKDYFMVCPKCGSTNTYHDLSKDMMAWGATTRWLCKDCDYSAIIFPKIHQSKIDEYRKNIKHRTKEQEDAINAQNISKGFLNRKLNIWFAFLYIITIISIILLVFSEGFLNKNYLLMLISLIVLFGFIIVLREYLK